MAIPIINFWKNYFVNPDEGLGSSYERIVLNRFLERIIDKHSIETVLEAPSFGFTGLSGINSLGVAKNGCQVTVVDHHAERLSLIKQVWESAGQKPDVVLLSAYDTLPFAEKSYDLSWNFSALWFAQDLAKFLEELTRVSRKCILLCVPNTTGLGYLSQKLKAKDAFSRELKEENIDPHKFGGILSALGWKLNVAGYIDCPPWPDIGMPKEKFLSAFGINLPEKEKKPLSILDYYRGEDRTFAKKMLKFYFFEKNIPDFVKFFWAHHRYYLFLPRKGGHE